MTLMKIKMPTCGVCVHINRNPSDLFSPLKHEDSSDYASGSETVPHEIRGSWVVERHVGAGCFGRVTLWKNMNTGEVIALKTYEKNDKKKPKNKEKLERRWTEELGFTRKLSHKNIVLGCKVPEVLNDSLTFPPIAMEYCSGGSLAELLLIPENSCGLPEFRVLKIAQDISSAVEYLHDRQIIHRDIKPGNIILKDNSERTVYKLIDFGFAKDMMGVGSTHSVCGTPMYIAPEIISDANYTFSVDYWSLGCVIFKTITGEIPFPHYRMAQGKYWNEFVLEKMSDIIHVYMDETGKIVSSTTIPFPNQLCRVTQNKLEKWLCLMLDADGQNRGGGLSLDWRPVCFVVLDEIIATKVIHIFSIPTNQLLSYSSWEDDITVHDLKVRIMTETIIPVEQQDIFCSSGDHLGENELIKEYSGEHGDNKMLLFLFPKSHANYWNPMNLPPLFKSTEHVLQGHKQKNHHALQTAWSEFLFYCNEVMKNYKQLLHAKNAVMLNLLQQHLRQMKKQDLLISKWQQMLSQNSKSRFSMSKKYLPGKSTDSQEVGSHRKHVDFLEKRSAALQKSVRELQSSKENDRKAQLATLNSIAVKCSNLLRRVIMDRTLKPGKSLLRPLVLEFKKTQEKLYSELFIQLRNIVACRTSLIELLQELDSLMYKIGIASPDDIEEEIVTSAPVTNAETPTTSNT